MFWTLLLFIITISILITIHELGHYWVARCCGVKVHRFSIGLGPALFSYQTGSGTEFTLAAIPLGGYVKMLDGRTDALDQHNAAAAFDKQSISKRAAIISAGPMANFIFAFFIYWIIFQVGVVSYPVKVATTISNSIAASLNILPDYELKSLGNMNISDWRDVRLALISALGQKELKMTYLPNKANNVVKQTVNIQHWKVDIEKEDPITAFGFVPKKPQAKPILRYIVPNSPAEQAGLVVGDRIVSVNGQPFYDWDQLADQIKQGQHVMLSIERKEKILSLLLRPLMQINKQTKREEGFAGIAPDTEVVVKKYRFFPALVKSLEQTVLMLKVTIRSFFQLITGSLSLSNLSGPVTLAKSANQTASYGIVAYLYFLAFISISLGVVNLIPLPILDGGHLLLLLIEKIKGSPLSAQTLVWIYKLSFSLLIMLMGIALFNDFSRL